MGDEADALYERGIREQGVDDMEELRRYKKRHSSHMSSCPSRRNNTANYIDRFARLNLSQADAAIVHRAAKIIRNWKGTEQK